jgi:16S rRNA (cytosine1402-N4)-methyltransferase
MVKHKPVLCSELIQYLDPKPGQNFIDATIGMGGHARIILSKTAPNGKILGIDWDPTSLSELRGASQRLVTYLGNFKNLKEIIRETGFKNISGIYFDLGLGSWQIEDPYYGLSFQKEMPLSMKISNLTFAQRASAAKAESQISNLTAKDIVNKYPEKELTKIFREYGEVRRPHQIAEKIIQYREKKQIQSTLELKEATGVKNPKVLAKIFQALRIVVNDELENLKEVLPQAVELLKKGGRVAVISYHSGEDRIVKNFFRQKQKQGTLKILTKKPVIPTQEEIRENPKARSAKLRVAEKIKN